MSQPAWKKLLDGLIANGEAIDLSTVNYTTSLIDEFFVFVGVSGDLKVDLAGTGTGLVYPSVPAGWQPLLVTKVYRTGTTATGLLSGW